MWFLSEKVKNHAQDKNQTSIKMNAPLKLPFHKKGTALTLFTVVWKNFMTDGLDNVQESLYATTHLMALILSKNLSDRQGDLRWLQSPCAR